MNAYELADELETRIATKDFEITKQSVNMLRQQADRIAELEKELEKTSKAAVDLREIHVNRIAELEKDLAIKTRDRDVFCDFTLAYEKRIAELEKLEQDFIRVIKQTNPNKSYRQLSDEEIIEIATLMEINYGCVPPLEFAWAIIKASRGEK